MKILSIDTSSDICGVSILEDKNLICNLDSNTKKTHSENLMPMIKKALKENNLSLKDINLIVCDKGPGSFTGIRIGISTIKAFSDTLNIPCIGVSSLKALSYNVKKIFDPNYNGLVCSLIDCKNSNCYYGLYEFKNGNCTTIIKPSTDNIENILNILKNYSNLLIIGDGVLNNLDIIKSTLSNYSLVKENNINSYSLGLAGIDEFKIYGNQNVLPLYLKKPQAQIQLELKLKGTN